MPLCGGIGNEKPVDDNVHALVSQVKPHVEAKLGSTLNQFTPLTYKSQVVAGMNYFVKVQTGPGDTDHIVIRIYRDLQGNVTYHSHQAATKDSEISYF